MNKSIKKFFNRQSVTALVFIAVIFAVFCASVFLNVGRYAYHVITGTETLSFENVSANIKNAFGSNIAFETQFIKAYSALQKTIDNRLFEDVEYGYIIKDENGSLHFPLKAQNTDYHANQTVKLKEELEKENIPLLYIVAPCKYIDGVTKLPYNIKFYCDENTDDFLSVLEKNGVDYLDLREDMKKSFSPDELKDAYFKTDHHWKHKTAFFAYKTALSYINSKYDLALDDKNIDNWHGVLYKNMFLGSQGRRIGAAAAGRDDLELLLPSFDTHLKVYDAEVSTDVPMWEGKLKDTIVRSDFLSGKDEEANMYAAYFGYDFSHLIIENENNSGKGHIILIKDSYALPFSAFLSTSVSTLEMIDLRAFDKTRLVSYIESQRPDMVVVMYTNSSFADNMYDFGI
ncbi:MAG: hypothetical protein J5922_02835 [Clostridia bacterium]|nr:hypothetical protein [Clostridia bacterium]